MNSIHLKCNICWKILTGPLKSYKLTCLHVFCSTCFRKSVDSMTIMNPKCPACDTPSTETTELEFSDELTPDTESKVISALFSNPTYWQGILMEAHQFVKMQLFQEVQKGQFESGARKLSANQTLERLRDAEQSIEMLQDKCEKKETHIFELEHRIRERNRQIEQLEKVVRRRRPSLSRYNSTSHGAPPAPLPPPPSSSRRQYSLNVNQRRRNTNNSYLRSVEICDDASNATSFTSSVGYRRPKATIDLNECSSTNNILSSHRPPSPLLLPTSSSHPHDQIDSKRNSSTTMKMTSSFRPKTPGLDALLREQEMLFTNNGSSQ